jgi:hypothetical protein
VGNKSGATRLGFALLLKFFEIEARFPRGADELPPVAVEYVGGQVKVASAALEEYPWSGRSIKYHREQVRASFGFREFSRGDEDKLAGWLAEEVCPVELRDPQLREAVLVHCRAERIEPPGRVDRIIGSARAVFEQRFCDRTLSRLDQVCVEALERLVADEDTGAVPGRALLAELKADPGQVGLETLLREIDKLAAVRALGLPPGLFSDASEKLVELLIGLIHRINARADRRVERELTEDLRRVRGKEAVLFRLAEAAVEHPDDTVRAVVFPVVGEKTPQELVREAKANEHAFQARVRTVLRGSYSNHYRRMLPPLLAALEFGCLPAGDAGVGAAGPLCRCGRQDPLLRRRRHGPDRRRRTAGLAGRGGR